MRKISIALLIVLLIATGLNVWLVAEIRKEQSTVAEILRAGVREDIERLGSMPSELRWQLVFTLVVLLVLIVSAVVIVFVVRAYLQSQQSLRDTERLARDILASTDHGVMTTDCDGIITSANPRAREMLGLSSECVGRQLDAFGSVGAALAQLIREVLEQGLVMRERQLPRDDKGRPFSLQAECHILRNASGGLLGGILHMRDVTEQVLMEERIRQMERFMGLGTLAAGLHHEIKNPLSALSLHVQLLEEGLEGEASEEVTQILGVLKTEVTRIAGVLESFRDYASIENLNASATDIGQLIQQTVDLIRPKAEQQHVAIRIELPASPLPPAWADAVRFEQVLLNLVINALEEMREGGTLSLSARAEHGRILVQVSDTGPGIPPIAQGRIFNPYFTTKSDGTGMGLAYCDKIIRLHQGEIDFETGRAGTTFYIFIPVARDA